MNDTVQKVLKLVEEYSLNLPPKPKMQWLDDRPVNGWIDHTLLKPEATPEQVQEICEQALRYQFAAVVVNPIYVPLVTEIIGGSPVQVCTVVGFPLGAVPTETKVFETRQAIRQGATEIDTVIPIGKLKGGEYDAVLEDISAVVEAAHKDGAIVKVIIETALLDKREKITAALLSREAGAEFVKTSTGFASKGATLEDVELLRRVVGGSIGVKAAGGVRSLADAKAMLQAGANRLGTSAGTKIMAEMAREMS